MAAATLDIENNYQPFPKQHMAHTSKARWLLFGGAVGPGKSHFLVQHNLAKALKYPGIPLLIARYDLIDLKRTTMKEWLKVVDPRLYDPKYGGQWNRTENWFRFANGSTIYFSGLKDYESWMSAELGMLSVDEAQEVPEETIRQLATRLRWTYKEGGLCDRPECKEVDEREHFSHPFYQIALCSNPHPGWLKSRFFDPWKNGQERPNHAFIPSLTRDNPALPPTYEQDLLEENNAIWVRRMLEGDWTAFEGMVFSNFNRASHMWRDERGALPPFAEVIGGIDWGATSTYAHRTAAVLVGRTYDNQYIAFWEYSKQGPAARDFFDTIRRLTELYRVRSWYCDPTQARAVELADTTGLPFKNAERRQGSRKTRINRLVNCFEFRRGAEDPVLMVHERCQHTITGIESYREVPETEATRGFGPVTEDPVRRDDDEVDALSYAMEGHNRNRRILVNQDLEVAGMGQKKNKSFASSVLEARRQAKHERLRMLLEGFEEDPTPEVPLGRYR